MQKFKKYIETWMDGKFVKGISVSLYDIHTCIDATYTDDIIERYDFVLSREIED